MLKKFAVLILACYSLLLIGCGTNNPTDAEIEQATHFDFSNENGSVIEKKIEYFSDVVQEELTNKEIASRSIGKPYYCVRINRSENSINEFWLRGVPRSTYELIKVGDKLPLRQMITKKTVYLVDGTVVDMEADLEDGKWYVALKELDGNINILPIAPDVYYDNTLMHKGITYPLSLPPEAQSFKQE